ncbi:MAG: BrnT family toxin [Rhizobiales bacterium]|nr:BrnT family toxin [Hyphomicrobiales bacterium]
MKILGFDWDTGNWPKCGKHGVSKSEIESVFKNGPAIQPDPFLHEERLRAIGRTDEGCFIFTVFMLRSIDDGDLIRPVSARYMHKKEIVSYERQTKA